MSRIPGQPTFRRPLRQDNIFRIWVGTKTRLARFCLWINMPLFCIASVLLVSGEPFPGLFNVLPWSQYTDLIVICVLLNVWMVLTLTLGFTSAVGYELYWNQYWRAPSLRNRVGNEEEAAMARVNRESGKQKFGAMLLIRGHVGKKER